MSPSDTSIMAFGYVSRYCRLSAATLNRHHNCTTTNLVLEPNIYLTEAGIHERDLLEVLSNAYDEDGTSESGRLKDCNQYVPRF